MSNFGILYKSSSVIFIILLTLFSGCANQSIKKAAEKGDPVAQNKLGWFYEAGIDVPRNFDQALHWYQLSADNGNELGKKNFERLQCNLNHCSTNTNQQTTSSSLPNLAVVKNVSVKLRNIDDLGIVLVINPDGKISQQSVEWSILGAGSRYGSLNSNLKQGSNLVIFILHNKSFSFGQGKWSYDFSLIGDNSIIWQNYKSQLGGDKGIQFWKAFVIDGLPNGLYAIRHTSDDETNRLQLNIAKLNSDLIKNQGHENSSDITAAIIGGAAVMYTLSNSSTSSQESSQSSYRNQDSYWEDRKKEDKKREEENNDIRYSNSELQNTHPAEVSQPTYSEPPRSVEPISPFYGECHNPMGC
jgi:hypothetical protein